MSFSQDAWAPKLCKPVLLFPPNPNTWSACINLLNFISLSNDSLKLIFYLICRLRDLSSLKVRAGEWDTQTKNELFPHQDRNVKSIVIHPDYYAGALYNDIGLIFLESAVEYAENVDVVCLPQQGAIFDHSQCFATGWGKDSYGM